VKKLRDIAHVEYTDFAIDAVPEVLEIKKEVYKKHIEKLIII